MQKNSKKLNSIVVGLMDYLADSGSQELLPDLSNTLANLTSQSKDTHEVTVTSVTSLTSKQLIDLKGILLALFKLDLPIRNKVDKSLLGGFTIKIADWYLDASLSYELSTLKKNLIS